MRAFPSLSMVALFLAIVAASEAQTYQQLYSFPGESSGDDIVSPLLRDSAGNFYGSAFSGGTSYGANCSFWGGCGLVFKVSASGQQTTLHNFGLTTTDGQNPHAGVVRDSAGNLYGTTVNGGKQAFGIVFKIDSSGKETILHSFSGKADGGYPQGGLLLDAAGNLYGTAEYGGNAAFCSGQGCGTIFKISAAGQFKVLYSFTGADGASPGAALIRDNGGNFYGTTLSGGTGNHGVVFKLDATGKETILHSFGCGTTDGGSPGGPLIRDSAGNFYGTTTFCGSQNAGTVFKLDSSGNLTLLHSFLGSQFGDGQGPFGGLLLDRQGNLYGTTSIGGAAGAGTVFQLTLAGAETILHNFTGAPSDGQEPDSSLTHDAAGNLYGTAAIGGGGDCPPGLGVGCGTIFKVVP